ncbi:hypothetical protein HYU12_00315 [Candidatus Woesearchaeota archaeon]|nr:hypothetical protein [Candidatus Woesearchaeota archaeon]
MSRQATFPYTREDGQLRPKIPVIFYNKDKPEFFERIVCLVDLGADTCVLPIDWKSRLKIKCDNDDDSINCACGQSKHFEIILPENYKDFTFKLND